MKPTRPSDELRSSGDAQEPLRIEIAQYSSLLQLLEKPKTVFRLVLTVGLLLLALFAGLSFVTLTIKQFYPYSDIRTNMLGATTVRDESTEVTYWLFNTADVWANSGIRVEEGDILTIRASGKAHTAIHHLVEDTEENRHLRDKWVGTEGDERALTGGARARGNYRIFAGRPQDALIMQVIPEERNENRFGREFYLRADHYITNDSIETRERLRHLDNFYFIGKERIDLRINQAGILHFAVNDILLTREIICRMLSEEYGGDWDADRKTLGLDRLRDSAELKRRFHDWYHTISARKPAGRLELGEYRGPCAEYAGKNELFYYYDTGYYNAWYDDNIGSLLVVIERKRKN